MLVIKIFSERKKVFKERKKCEKIHAQRGKTSGMVTHDLEGHEFEAWYGLSKIQLEHVKKDKFVVVVVKVVHERSEGESFLKEGDDFRVDVLRFHTCLIDILGFLEKLEWWFEQDIDDDEEEDEEGEGGSEEMFWDGDEELNEMIHHHFHQGHHPTNEMGMDDLEWWRRRN
nr:hypothetical protein [Tanacetum cinerariifolium]